MSVYPGRSSYIQKRLFGNILSLAVGIILSVLMFQIFTADSLQIIKTLSFDISAKTEIH